MHDADVLIIGAGAAGLQCAIVAGNRGRRVVVLEGSNKAGKKILMSGGGRCNFTNLNCDPSFFLSGNPQFCISALSRYTPRDFVAMVEAHDIPYHEKTAGQLFCDNSSKDIVAMLLSECDNAGVQIRTNCEVKSVTRHDRFHVRTSTGDFRAPSLVIASGGLSIPKMGASGFGYELARQFGHTIVNTRAALVPLTFTGSLHEMMQRLSGISLTATVSTTRQSFSDEVLFTHRGLSGPAILQLSSYWSAGDAIVIDLLPGSDAAKDLLDAKRARSKSLLRNVLADRLPRALVQEVQGLFWPAEAERPLAEIADDRLLAIAAQLHHWALKPAATEGYRTAEVTLGGVDTTELSSRTMESLRQPGLYFIGEVVDVTGHLGGFNFQWAWASGHAAGEVV
ncbi:MAG: NAD(P)/FAD-dependent oxidoreductase [Gammaproteobacteria bacterium]|nr:NAD(P)/FAD-dependent oxidoreductase [Gammaproteobacteria bacterium]